MYTGEMAERPWVWDILDPDGDLLAQVGSAEEADALLSHLNRGGDSLPVPRPPQ